MATKPKLNVKRTLHYYFDALMHFKGRTILFILIVPLNVFASAVAVPYAASNIIALLSQGITDLPTYAPLLAIYVGALIFHASTIRIIDWIDWSLDARGGYYLSNLAYEKLINESMSFHNSHFSGALTSQLNRFTNAFIRIKSLLGWNIYPLLLSLTYTVIIIARVSGVYAVILASLLFLFVFSAAVIFTKTNKVEIRLPEAESKQTGALADSITNILNVKSFAREDYEQKRFLGFARKTRQATMGLAKASFARNTILDIINSATAITLILLIIRGHNTLGISIANVLLIYNLTMSCNSQVWQTTHILRDVNRSFGDAKEMVEILDTPTAITNTSTDELTVRQAEVDFHDITFQHDDQDELLFKNFSLKIKPGERIGLVGVSGSGKTTLTKLLLRFAELQGGHILIDGQDISKVSQQSLRRAITYVPQESILFHRSIAENISYGRPGASQEEIIHAAKLAGADDFIRKLPEGYKTLTGERGVKLSGGQRQRIAIARAILKDAPILVLDEATSALDSESEALIQKSMAHLMKNRTSIVVAHRLSTIANLDRIVVLKDGKIIEQGSHRQLLLKNGAYKKLWSRQSGAFLEQDDESSQ